MASTARNRDMGRQALTLLSALALVGLTSLAAQASEVVDVRIGAHPGFTRIVFELDTSAGYRVERANPQPGVSEVLVSIDASSIPRDLQSSKGLVSSVRIVPQGGSAVAHIRMTKEGLRLKQMILGSPPRIVLDVLAPAIAESAEPKKPAPAPTQKAEKPAPKPAPKASVTPAPKPTPTPKPAPAEAKPVAPAPPPVLAQRPDPTRDEADQEDEFLDASAPTPAPPPSPPSPAPPIARTPVPTPPAPTLAKPPSGAVAPPPAASPSGAPMHPGASPSKPMPLAPVPKEEGMGMGTVGGLLALLALVAVVVLVVLRRRSAAVESVEFDGVSSGGEENPFAGLGYADDAQPPLSAGGARQKADEDDEESPFAGLDEVTVEPVDEESAQEQAPRTTAMELGGDEMDVQTIGGGAGASSGSRVGRSEVAGDLAGSDEVTRMLREFERRIASLETRLDEVVDARERLERQVAAQTEELRVQRAAIARTQRAVRNLTRGDEDIATEPAPRDPDRPRSGE